MNRPAAPPIEFRAASMDTAAGAALADAMRAEIAVLYDGLELDGPGMPKAGPAELGPPRGAFLVGWAGEEPVCCGGIKALEERTCEFKKMYVVPALRGRGVARLLLRALETRARALGHTVGRLDTGPRQEHARRLFLSEGYAEIADFNGNPAAAYWFEKPLV